ncbi:hypothetical protein [Cryptosporangium sp. NPDC051539]|uniref:hypothetical protein n=1 Tax=Cryptosporangium sp. NPDC051539 TaxID=3363962 RepID=UPI0037A0955B
MTTIAIGISVAFASPAEAQPVSCNTLQALSDNAYQNQQYFFGLYNFYFNEGYIEAAYGSYDDYQYWTAQWNRIGRNLASAGCLLSG